MAKSESRSPMVQLSVLSRRLFRVARRVGRRKLFLTLAIVLVAASGVTAVIGSWPTLLPVLALAAMLAVTLRDVRQNRIMVHQLRRQVQQLEHLAGVRKPPPSRRGTRAVPAHSGAHSMALTVARRLRELQQQHALDVHDLALAAGGSPSDFLRPEWTAPTALAVLNRGDVLDAHALASATRSLQELSHGALRRLRNELRKRGYLTKALEVAATIESGGLEESDKRSHRLMKGEATVLSGQFRPYIAPQPGLESVPRRVVHLVGRSLPEHQVGYTIRTHYLAVAQRDLGLDPHVVTQMGVSHDGSGDHTEEIVDGIVYHRVAGPHRASEPHDVWLQLHVERVADLVRRLRPAALHAASDLYNAITARVIGDAFGIPVVYESRGFWEETWLSQHADRFGWDLAKLEAKHQLPDVYRWRREIEDRCRREADHVVTLADVMANRVEAGGVPRDRITVVPNAVDIDSFPLLEERDHELAASLGIKDDAVVVGYISSLVEYEGIDTLLAAFAEVKVSYHEPLALVIVGDGSAKATLEAYTAELGVDDVVFTGQVPHREILRYYSLIDVFVVPRRPVEVCHLVTPLKPFEAFSTGRTVVLSNVRALAAIALESGAAETFEAGDPTSLARVLTALLCDPGRRHVLAARGAAWVRATRTWTAIALTYAKVYEGLGILPLGELRMPRLNAAAVDLAGLRRGVAARPRIPFELLGSADLNHQADEIMSVGWSLGTHPRVRLDLPIDWANLCASNRSWDFHLHAWDFMGPVLNAYDRTSERRYLEWCVERAVSWARQFNEAEAADTMAWYDMALGLRGHRLAYLYEQALLLGFDDNVLAALLACVVRHQKEFFADHAFNPHSNHGVFVALGELALARRLGSLPGMDILETQGRERLDQMITSQFGPDGGHVEHSPDYHRMLLDTFREAMRVGLIDDSDLRNRTRLAEDVLGWLIQPDGALVQVGDTQAVELRSQPIRCLSPTTQFLLTDGRRGEPDTRTMLVLPDTGYAIVRCPQPGRGDDQRASSYLFFMAAFHSRVHKHADDLSLVWFDRGQELLIDAGRFGYVNVLPKDSPLRLLGYYYDAPERQYVESTRAHNTVEADGMDHVRRAREPYGSALLGSEERAGHYRIRAQVDHGAWRHHREVILHPGRWLYVIDTVNATNGERHDFRVWWNLPGELNPLTSDLGLHFVVPGVGNLWLTELSGAQRIAPASGQRDPMRGWRSKVDNVLTPAWSTGFEVLQVREYRFQTCLRFGPEPPSTPPRHPFE